MCTFKLPATSSAAFLVSARGGFPPRPVSAAFVTASVAPSAASVAPSVAPPEPPLGSLGSLVSLGAGLQR